MERTTRTFLALELDAATRSCIQQTAAALAPALPDTRLTTPESWHITLAFLGDLDGARLAAARRAAQAAGAAAAPFVVRAAGAGIFGSPAQPRVVWVGVGGDRAALAALQQRVAAALATEGFALDARFAPHITLARPRRPLDAQAAAALALALAAVGQGPDATVAALSVMRSDRLPAGARYTCLERVPFGR